MSSGEISRNLDEMLRGKNLLVVSCYRKQVDEPVDSKAHSTLHRFKEVNVVCSSNTCLLGRVVICQLNTFVKALRTPHQAYLLLPLPQ